jgi:hypothetical protein
MMHGCWLRRLLVELARRTKETPPSRVRIIHFFLWVFLVHAGPLLAKQPDDRSRAIKSIIREFRTQLKMPLNVRERIVRVNDRMVSVEHIRGKSGDIGLFVICFDERFLASLSAEELRAAIAHELGHVWIYTHHPYLHTEALANEIAMKLVSRESLEKTYMKLWTQTGVTGNIEEFIAPEKVESGTHAANR